MRNGMESLGFGKPVKNTNENKSPLSTKFEVIKFHQDSAYSKVFIGIKRNPDDQSKFLL